MKATIALLAVAGLSGCVAYPAPYGPAGAYYGDPNYGASVPYAVEPGPSVYIYGNSGYSRAPRSYRDRDRDGVPNRYDRDRDGDRVPNWRDAYPNDPRRR